MHKKKSVHYEIGFADSEILSYFSKENDLIIMLQAWNEKKIKFTFIDCIAFEIFNNWYISDVCESSDSQFKQRALSIIYEKIPSDTPYKFYQFLDVDDEIAIEIGAKDLIISTI